MDFVVELQAVDAAYPIRGMDVVWFMAEMFPVAERCLCAGNLV